MCLEICLHMFAADSPFQMSLNFSDLKKYCCSLNLSCQLFVILGKSEISKSDNLMPLVCFWIVHLHKRTFNRGFQGENLIPCGGSLVYFKDIWRRLIGKFLFTSVVIHSLACVTQVSPKKSHGVSNFQLLASPEVDVGAANPLHHCLHQLLAEVEQQVAVLRRSERW